MHRGKRESDETQYNQKIFEINADDPLNQSNRRQFFVVLKTFFFSNIDRDRLPSWTHTAIVITRSTEISMGTTDPVRWGYGGCGWRTASKRRIIILVIESGPPEWRIG